MNYYFYLIHVLNPNVVSLQVPIYIEASDVNDASQKADVVKNLFQNQFQLLFEPSQPVLFVQSINAASFGSFFSKLGNGNKVKINLPVGFNINLFQYNLNLPALTTLDALVLVVGNHPTVYSL